MLRPVINATGVVLHTGLGRAPLPTAAVDAVSAVAAGYASVEFDLADGSRRSRTIVMRELLRELTGAESAAVVNNNAGATLLALTAVVHGGSGEQREVVVSRGELIEIGGSFRLPDIMSCGGAVLREVGTSNRTTLADYAAAVGPRTAALMKVHTSNYRVVGYTEEASISELVELGKTRGLPVIYDLGSGAVAPLPDGIAGAEPMVADAIAAGCDLVLFSGDKLLGGPQAGILVGRAAWIDHLESHPLSRALRVDKMTIAALEATLRLHHDPERGAREIPTLAMLATPVEVLRTRARSICDRLVASGWPGRAETVETVAGAGGGALPAHDITSFAVRVTSDTCSETVLARRLRLGALAVVGRLADRAVLLDLRTVPADDDKALVQALLAAAEE